MSATDDKSNHGYHIPVIIGIIGLQPSWLGHCPLWQAQIQLNSLW